MNKAIDFEGLDPERYNGRWVVRLGRLGGSGTLVRYGLVWSRRI